MTTGRLIVFLATVLVLASDAQAATLTVYPTAPGEDTYVYGGEPTTPQCNVDQLAVGNIGTSQWWSLLEFDASALPAGATITSATLRLVVNASPTGGGPSVCKIKKALASWDECTVAWDSKPSVEETDPAPVTCIYNTTGAIDHTVTAHVADATSNEAEIVRFAIVEESTTSVHLATFYRVENGTESNRPRLIIDYAATTPTPVPTPTPCGPGCCRCGASDCTPANIGGSCPACPDATTTPVSCPTCCCDDTCPDARGNRCGDNLWHYFVNDYAITVTNTSEVAAKRAAIIDFVWGAPGFPSSVMPATVDIDVTSPVDNLTDLARVDALTFVTEDSTSYGYHFIPDTPNNKVVLLNPGHTCTFNDSQSAEPTNVGFGMWRTIETLLTEGYSVLAFYMPYMSHLDPLCFLIVHPFNLARLEPTVTNGHPIKIFYQPPVVALNYLSSESVPDSFPTYTKFFMVGLSGGGWTTLIHSAIDTRISTSIKVAGSWPLYMRDFDPGWLVLHSQGVAFIGDDMEQFVPELYTLAGYLDMYILASAGTGRKHVQVFHRAAGAFGLDSYDAVHGAGAAEAKMDAYEERIQEVMTAGSIPGTFADIVIDEEAVEHQISWWTITDVIVPVLNAS